MTSGTSASLGNKKHGRRHKMGAGKHKRPVWGPDHGKGKDKFAAYRNNVVIYGHWFSSRRSDVSFYSKAGKPIAPGPKLYEQTTRVLSRELANGMTGNKQRTVFLGFPPIKNAKTGDVCSHDSKWSRAVQAGLALCGNQPVCRVLISRR